MKRFLTTVLALMMVLSVCYACTTEGDATESSDVTTVGTKEETTQPLTDNLPDGLDYDGYQFRVLTYQNSNEGTYLAQYFDPTEGADVVSSAAINRNLAVEDRLDCEIVCNELTYGAGAGVYNLVYTAVMNGEDICDVANIHVCENVAGLLALGGLYDYRTMQYVDFDQPWYVQGFNEQFYVGGTQYLISGSYNNSATMPLFTWFNKKMMGDLGLELPYELAMNGGWTLDKFIEYMDKAYLDIDGENGPTAGDRWGCSDLLQSYAYMCSGFNIDVVQKNADDTLTLNLTSEKLVDVVTKLNELVWDNPNVNANGDGHAAFKEGRALFNTFLSSVSAMREIEGFEYGILPMPKWDETQEHYTTYSPASYFVTPAYITDPDRTGAILEALNATSYFDYREAVISNLIQTKILLTDEDVAIYNMAIENQYIEFARYLPFSTEIKTYTHILNFLKNNDNGVASWAESNRGAIQDAFNVFYEYLGL